jgi:hypothetical protein
MLYLKLFAPVSGRLIEVQGAQRRVARTRLGVGQVKYCTHD